MPDGDAPSRRRLQPWGVVCWRGRWYVVGHDLDRDATRCFRLSRVVGAVRVDRRGRARTSRPPGVDLISHVARWSGPVERTGRATVLVAPGPGRRAAPLGGGDHRRARTATGWSCRTPTRTPSPASSSGYGADVRVLDPPEVREAVIQRLKEIAARHDELAVAGGAR